MNGSVSSWSDVDDAVDPAWLIAYLDRMTWRMRRWKWRSFELLAVRRGDRVLDIGCGAGDDVRALATLVGRQGLAVGVDVSRQMLTEAAARNRPTARVAFVVAEAARLPFADGAFAACRSERTLAFIDDPAAAVAEAARATRAGGRVLISDRDSGMTAIDADDAATTRAVLEFRLEERSIRCPLAGRQLQDFFARSAMQDVSVTGAVDIVRDLPLADATMGLRAATARAVAHGRLSALEGEAWLEDLQRRSTEGRFLAAFVLLTVVGTKPGGPGARFAHAATRASRWVRLPRRLEFELRAWRRARGVTSASSLARKLARRARAAVEGPRSHS